MSPDHGGPALSSSARVRRSLRTSGSPDHGVAPSVTGKISRRRLARVLLRMSDESGGVMDLRVSLVGRLIGFFLLLSALAAAAVMHALREDVAEEIEASALLAELMLSVAQAPDQGLAQITALIERGG